MATITQTEAGATGRFISFGTAPVTNLFNTATGGTVIAYVKPAAQSVLGYLAAKGDSTGAGMRLGVNTAGQVFFSPYAAGGINPTKTTAGGVTNGVWQHWQATATGNGDITYNGLAIYVDAGADSSANIASGSGGISSDAGNALYHLNRVGLGREFVGEVAYIAFWNRVLSSTERATVRATGPLDVPSGLVYCYANGIDNGPSAYTLSSRSTFVAGSTPPNTALGGSTAAALAGAASATATITGGLTTGIPLAVNAVATATVTGDLTAGSLLAGGAFAVATASAGLTTSISVQAAASATASATGSLGVPLAIASPADRGTLDLPNCSITPNGLTPQINLKNRYIGDANTTGARFTFGTLTGVNGMTPVIKVDRSNMEINASAKFLWSTTGLKGSWTAFANFTSDASFFTISHNAAFTSDTIYFASNNPWPVGYTLPWINSLVASGFVSPAPSGAGSYQFETRSATTDGATAGVGNVIAAQPLYAFKISSGAGNAPDGLPKRSIVLLAGTHAAEDVGNYALEGAVAFLTSADAQAVIARNWCNFYVYPLTATAGRAGGGQRNDFENTLKTTDVNREWPNANLETVVKHKTAIQTDAGSTLALLLDFHGTHLSNEGAYDWYNGLNQTTWTNAVRTYLAGLEIRSNGTAGLASKWGVDSKSARHGVSPEYPYHNDEVMATLLAYGEKHMRAIAHLADAGEFVGLTGNPTAQATGTAALSTGIQLAVTASVVSEATGALAAGAVLQASAQAIASSSGQVTTQIVVTASALAQAVSSALLSSGIIMTAASVSQAAASGLLTTAINLLAAPTAQATATASLGGGSQLSAAATAQSAASADLTIQIRLAGSAISAANAGAGLSTQITMSANALAQAIATGGLTVVGSGLTGAAVASADASAWLLAAVRLAANASVAPAASAVLTGGMQPVLRYQSLAAEAFPIVLTAEIY